MKKSALNLNLPWLLGLASFFGIAISVLLSTTVISNLFTNYARDTLIENTSEIAANLAKNSTYSLIFKSSPSAEEAVSYVASLSNTSYIALYANDGTLLFGTGGLPDTEKLKILPDIRKQQIVKESSNEFHMLVPVFVTNEEYRRETLDSQRSGRTAGSDTERIGTVYLVTSKSSIIRANKKVRNGLWAISATAGVLSLLLILIITRRLTTPLSQLTLAMREAERTMSFKDVPVRGSVEVRHISEAYNRLTHELMVEKKSLESRVNERTMELSKANETNRILIKQMNSILEQERRLLACEIHDELNGMFVAIRLKLEYTKKRLFPLAPQIRGGISDNISEAMQLVNEGYEVAHKIRHRLRPEAIEIVGLQGVIDDLIENYNKLKTPCYFSITYKTKIPDLGPQAEIELYRIIQECLTNVARHSSANAAYVEVFSQIKHKKEHLMILIRDDGGGFDQRRHTSGAGLSLIRERAYGIGATLHLISTIGHGTTVEIGLPIPTLQSHPPASRTTMINGEAKINL